MRHMCNSAMAHRCECSVGHDHGILACLATAIPDKDFLR